MKQFDLDERRVLVLPGDHDATIKYAVEQWIAYAHEAIKNHGSFACALSGGSTPKMIFQQLSTAYNKAVDWKRVTLFWSDERAVPPTHPDSNYHMAMQEAGLSTLPILESQIFRMIAETKIEKNAAHYEKLIRQHVKGAAFDLIMLGMGDDGHTASLFPYTDALKVRGKLVTANYVPKKESYRMTFTYECINQAQHISLYVLGANKAEILEKVLLMPLDKEMYPSQNVGTAEHKAQWIIDEAASQALTPSLKRVYG